MARKLLIIRGNSGSGKTTIAKQVRIEILRRGFARQAALVEQDYFRRIVLKEKEAEGSNNLGLLRQTVLFCLEQDYDVVLEGILWSASIATSSRNWSPPPIPHISSISPSRSRRRCVGMRRSSTRMSSASVRCAAGSGNEMCWV